MTALEDFLDNTYGNPNPEATDVEVAAAVATHVASPTAHSGAYEPAGTVAGHSAADDHSQYLNTARHDVTARHPTAVIADGAITTVKIADANVTAAKLASEAWTPYTPATSGVTLGNGTLEAAYQRIGRTIHWRVKLTFGTTTAFTAVPRLALPVQPNAFYNAQDSPVGAARSADLGVSTLHGPCVYEAAGLSGLAFIPQVFNAASVYVSGNSVSPTTPFVWATGDILWATGTYEAAS